MRIGLQLDYSGGFAAAVNDLRDLESAGLDVVQVAEVYTFDAVSQLGYIAAKTDRLQIASGIVNIYSRTPALLAMTAAGLDHVSDGRFNLGIGASGPQVIEGFHGVPFDSPLGRTREIIEICRTIWRREPLDYAGKFYTIPLPADQGTGLGKPLKLINHPVRDRIPISLASIRPRGVALAAELAEGWIPIFFHPGRADSVYAEPLAKGLAKRDPALGELQVSIDVMTAVGGDTGRALQDVRNMLALYIGGMGARGANFYHDLASRYGYAEEADAIQDLYLTGRRDEAAAKVPEDLIRGVSMIGSESEVAAKIAEFAAAGITTISLNPVGDAGADHASRLKLVETIASLTR